MKKWSFVVLLVLGATILGATLLREPIATAAQTVNANIIGPLDNGNVRVHEEGTANVSASQAGLWTVRDRDNPALHPYTDSVTVSLADGQDAADAAGVRVPRGKRLVIEEVTASASLASNQVPRFNFAAPSVPGSFYYMPMVTAGAETSNRARYVTNELTRIYLEQGETFRAILLRPSDNTDGPAFMDVRISGYLFDS